LHFSLINSWPHCGQNRQCSPEMSLFDGAEQVSGCGLLDSGESGCDGDLVRDGFTKFGFWLDFF
jgi:hypothetical protein